MLSHHFSIEFFPPKTPAGFEKLRKTRERLYQLAPDFFSVTLGAGGSTQVGTHDVALEIHKEGRVAAPHVTCIGTTRSMILERILAYKEQGIRRIVALRGDLPNPYGSLGEFHYANDLVEFIRKETGDWFSIAVAAYPEMHPRAPSPQEDLKNFVRKMNAGANMAITQYFYNPDAYFYFVEAAAKEGITAPIIPGIMPITNYANLVRFSNTCGAEIPRWIRLKLEGFGEDAAAVQAFGLDVVTHLCERLMQGGAPGFHFYSLNQAEPVEAICQRLNLSGYRAKH